MAGAATTTRAFSASAPRDIAKITLVGNLAATPEIKATSTGRDIIEYAVASNEGSGENRRTSWFKVATFAEEGPRRDFLTSLPKGYVHWVMFVGQGLRRCLSDMRIEIRRSEDEGKRVNGWTSG